MKKAILILTVLFTAQAVTVAHAAEAASLTVLLNGGPEADSFAIQLSPDGRTYEIDSAAALEVGGTVCWHPGGLPLRLLCDAPPIAAFEVNGEAGDDVVEVGDKVLVPVTLSGGPGDDRMFGGLGEDKLSGGDGFDRLQGGGGSDSIAAGAGSDIAMGGWGNDQLAGEGGQDSLVGGGGDDSLAGGLRHDSLYGGIGRDRLDGGEGRDSLFGGPGDDRFISASADGIFGGPGLDVAIPGGAVE
jgi:RTX calcium-binding nonapeptide repeat (4 copies)